MHFSIQISVPTKHPPVSFFTQGSQSCQCIEWCKEFFKITAFRALSQTEWESAGGKAQESDFNPTPRSFWYTARFGNHWSGHIPVICSDVPKGLCWNKRGRFYGVSEGHIHILPQTSQVFLIVHPIIKILSKAFPPYICVCVCVWIDLDT